MDIETRFDAMRKNGIAVPRPLELLGGLDPDAAAAHLDAKAATFAPGSSGVKAKALMAVAAAVALDAAPCIRNNVELAARSGAGEDEIMEAIAVARFIKGSVVVSATAPAMEWLAERRTAGLAGEGDAR